MTLRPESRAHKRRSTFRSFCKFSRPCAVKLSGMKLPEAAFRRYFRNQAINRLLPSPKFDAATKASRALLPPQPTVARSALSVPRCLKRSGPDVIAAAASLARHAYFIARLMIYSTLSVPDCSRPEPHWAPRRTPCRASSKARRPRRPLSSSPASRTPPPARSPRRNRSPTRRAPPSWTHTSKRPSRPTRTG